MAYKLGYEVKACWLESGIELEQKKRALGRQVPIRNLIVFYI